MLLSAEAHSGQAGQQKLAGTSWLTARRPRPSAGPARLASRRWAPARMIAPLARQEGSLTLAWKPGAAWTWTPLRVETSWSPAGSAQNTFSRCTSVLASAARWGAARGDSCLQTP